MVFIHSLHFLIGAGALEQFLPLVFATCILTLTSQQPQVHKQTRRHLYFIEYALWWDSLFTLDVPTSKKLLNGTLGISILYTPSRSLGIFDPQDVGLFFGEVAKGNWSFIQETWGVSELEVFSPNLSTCLDNCPIHSLLHGSCLQWIYDLSKRDL